MVRRSYPTDLSDQEWKIIKEILEREEPYTTGHPPEVDLREIWNAIFYINKTGCQWQYLPHDFPPPTTVNYHYLKWMRKGIYQKVNEVLRQQLRKKIGRNENPSAAIIDSQSVKGTRESGQQESGFDGGKLVKGRKRHIIVDTMGYLLVVLVHAASIVDCKGAKPVIEKLFETLNTVKLIWADGGYKGKLIDWVKKEFDCVLEIVKKKKKKGFHVLPRRWVVERTFAWLTRFRRLSKDYEKQPSSSEAMVYVASIRLMLRRLCEPVELAEAA
ncbi:MAG: IS5 family transposase [Candidatus Competibacteraceae bacterium]